MAVWIFIALVAVITLIAVALSCRRIGFADALKRIRKVTVYVLTFAVACIIGVAIFLSTFSYASNFLSSVLSPEYISDAREILKALFGSESVFTSLQMLGALSLFLFSFASCAFCVFSVFIFYISRAAHTEKDIFGGAEKNEEISGRISLRRFAVFSRYLI